MKTIHNIIMILLLIFMIGCQFQSRIKPKNLSQMNIQAKKDKVIGKVVAIDVIYPEDNMSTDKQSISIIATVYGGDPVKDIAVYANKRMIKQYFPTGKDEMPNRKIPLDVSVPLELKKNEINIIATTDTGNNVNKTIIIERIKPVVVDIASVTGKKWAVIIGISEYFYSERGITPLQFAHDDAIAIKNFLRSPQGGGFASNRTRLLINEQATTKNIRSSLFTFLKNAGKDDLVLIFFAGHGAPEPGRPDNLYLITYDTNPDDLASTAFPMWDMETALKRYIISERVIVIADACHSGGVGGEAGLRNLGNNNLINTYMSNLQKTKPGRAIITASETNELSREGSKWDNHGVFTYYFLKGLQGEADINSNGIVTIGEAFNYVYNKVRRATSSQQHPDIQGKFDRNLPLAVIR